MSKKRSLSLERQLQTLQWQWNQFQQLEKEDMAPIHQNEDGQLSTLKPRQITLVRANPDGILPVFFFDTRLLRLSRPSELRNMPYRLGVKCCFEALA